MTYGFWSAGAVRYWSESTPIANFLSAAAALNTPPPDPPAAANTTSAPASYMPCEVVWPFCGSLNPPKSGGWVRYLLCTLIDGSTACTPAMYPASNFCSSGVLTPPM